MKKIEKMSAATILYAVALVVAGGSARAGTYQIYSDATTKNIYNTTATTGSVNATYYRDLIFTFQGNMTGAFAGYGPAYIRHYCNGTQYAQNTMSVPGSSWQSYSHTLPNGCELTNVTINITGSGWFNPGSNEVRNMAITGIKDPPVATAQSFSVNENTTSSSIALNVSDPQSAPLTKTVTVAPTNGTLNWTGTNFTYTPTACYSGSDSFQYYVTETVRSQTSATRTVSITVNPVNNPPTINAISDMTIPWHSPLTINFSGVAKGLCGGTLSVTATSSNTAVLPHPTVSYTNPNTTGSITITPVMPVTGQSGTSTVTLTVSDGVNTNTLETFVTTVQWVSLMHK